MSFTVGIGALIDEKTFNKVRSLELTAAINTGNYEGLSQPPHITVKRPFQVKSIADITKLKNLVADIAQDTPAFDIAYDRLGSFNDATLFLAVTPSRQLNTLHETLCSKLREVFESTEALYEGEEMKYHTSIALGLQGHQLQQLLIALDDISLPSTSTIGGLGIFLRLDTDKQWISLFELRLGSGSHG